MVSALVGRERRPVALCPKLLAAHEAHARSVAPNPSLADTGVLLTFEVAAALPFALAGVERTADIMWSSPNRT